MTSTEETAPGVGNDREKWDIQSYEKYERFHGYSSEVFDDGGGAERVIARHIVLYNNVSDNGVVMSEFEVYGTGMRYPDNRC